LFGYKYTDYAPSAINFQFDEMFPNQEHVICVYCLLNRDRTNYDLVDPSARELPN